ncbi:NAD(P)-binding domain-containing protein [Actinoplanes sp. TBRC 11911]|uniref:NADPH-dependent F420 reductase n=1 Tax=Actinoplanes sp. TBRC 11911 TaxID=2729386 RepID=UPI00145D35C6|nr:NAD(P)-binding domain-containing protein [Actinoplanes sp. TBRC 11911]NMO50733.1 NAD(P)-binding domain-containing protein [Actinoplanes sp. TBRC 11911]
MKVAVIGAGAFGGAFAKAAVAAGHDVSITARNSEHATKAAADSGATARTNDEAIDRADVVVLGIPGLIAAEWADEFAAKLSGKVLIDATNPVNADMSDTFTAGASFAEELQKKVPTAHVAKAFNAILASRMSAPREAGTPLDAFVAGDDATAKQAAVELAGSLGFGPRDIGGLRMARSLEEIAFLNIALNKTNGWQWQSAFQLVGPTAA